MAGATAVVCAAFDDGGDAAVEAVRSRAEALGLAVRRTHRPHLTLSAARVLPGPDLDALVGVTGAIAGRHRAFELTFGSLATFATGVLWLGPRPGDPLRALQRDVYSGLERAGWPAAFGHSSRPDEWVPHCTVATRISPSRLGEVRAALLRTVRPFAARVDALSVLLVGGEGDVARLPLSG